MPEKERAKAEFHPLFWDDVENNACYLEHEAGLGAAFLDGVQDAIEAVLRGPLMWSCLYGNTRHYRLLKFCRHVIHYEYFPAENLVRFYALFHGSENPDKWAKRK